MNTARTTLLSALVAATAFAAPLVGCNGGEEETATEGDGAPVIAQAPARNVSDLGLSQVTSEIPDTFVGSRLGWTIDLINVHYEDLDNQTLLNVFAPSVFENVPVDDLRDMLVVIATRHAPIALVGYREEPTEHHAVAVLRFANLQYRELTITVGEDDPNQIVTFQFSEF